MVEIAGWVVACILVMMWWFSRNDGAEESQAQAALSAEKRERESGRDAVSEPTQDALERELAEMQNALKRRERESVKKIELAIDGFARALFPVDTALDHAISAGGDLEEYRTGVELVQKLMRDAFQEHHLCMIKPDIGDIFDPEVHHCLLREDAEDAGDDSDEAWEIRQVVRVGWSLHGRLLQAAEVTVGPAQGERDVHDEISEEEEGHEAGETDDVEDVLGEEASSLDGEGDPSEVCTQQGVLEEESSEVLQEVGAKA